MKAVRHTLLVLLMAAGGFAADDGGTVSPFSFGAGARDLALGGACLAESDFEAAPFWNASRLARAEQYGLNGFHTNLYDSDVAYQYLGIVVPTVNYGGFGIGVFRLGVSGIEVRDEGNLLMGEIDDSRLGLNVAYGNTFSGYDVGVTMTMERHSLGEYTATSSPGVNLAAGRRFGFRAGPLRHLSVTLVGRNLLAPRYKLAGESVSLPTTAIAGVSFGLVPVTGSNQSVTLSASLTKIESIDPRLAAGLEYTFFDLLSLRGGVREGKLACGVGLDYRGVSFDYALVDRDLGSLHMFSLGSTFGTPVSEKRRLESEKREQQFNQLMSDRLTARNRDMISELVTSGREALDNGDLVQASDDFDRALFLARANDADTAEIAQLASETARRLEEVTHIHRLAEYLDSSQASYDQGEYLAARYFANLALAEEPQSSQAASLLRAVNEAISALASQEKMVDDNLRQVDSLLSYGQITQAMKVVNSLKQFAGSDRRVTLAYNRVRLERWKADAMTAFNAEKNETAIVLLDSALTLFPGHQWCKEMRSRIVLAMKRPATPTVVASAPIVQPLSSQMLKEVGDIYVAAQQYFEKGDLASAIENWERVERLAPDYENVRGYLVQSYKYVGVELYSKNKLQDAVVTWKKAVALDPHNGEIQSYITRTETEIRKLHELSYED